LLPGKAADTAKHGKLILKAADGNAAGEAVVTISSTAAVSKYALTADDIDITSQTSVDIQSATALALTTATGQTMTLGASGGNLVTHNAVVATLEGGLAAGLPCVGTGAVACGTSGVTFNPLRATITRIIKATCTVDASGTPIATGTETAYVCLLNDAKLYDTATASPPSNPGASLLWNAYVRDGKIIIIVANLAASTAYSTNSNWHIVLFKYTTYTSTAGAGTSITPAGTPGPSAPTFPYDLALSGIASGETFELVVVLRVDTLLYGGSPSSVEVLIGSGDDCVNPEGGYSDPLGMVFLTGSQFADAGLTYGDGSTEYGFKVSVRESVFIVEYDRLDGNGYQFMHFEMVDYSTYDVNHRITLGQHYCDGTAYPRATGIYHSVSIVGT
jgi:hypothetical protein